MRARPPTKVPLPSALPGETLSEETTGTPRELDSAVPGLILVYANGKPTLETLPVTGAGAIIGRSALNGRPTQDDRLSWEHAHVACKEGVWTVRDLGSRNGSFVDDVDGSEDFAQITSAYPARRTQLAMRFIF